MRVNAKKLNAQVAANLKRIRKDCGYKSACEFARLHNIPAQTYLNHESGKRGMDLATLAYYAALLNVPYTEITGDVSKYIKLESKK